VLWIAPFLVVLAGAALLLVRLRARPAEAELTSAEAAQLKKLQRDETR
jgi:cytochrome c-type biogenesis protein CcmH/NrfF